MGRRVLINAMRALCRIEWRHGDNHYERAISRTRFALHDVLLVSKT
jgi:hypothetical protein